MATEEFKCPECGEMHFSKDTEICVSCQTPGDSGSKKAKPAKLKATVKKK